ncbi:uncharacterized protein PHACADRAFT_191006 [Phanerochaete carnosa HHB-10118-sp]|uniref:FAD-binding domain-containing protein n=1 Tax=Phanerochaete carnosa (strain HHB-10118-sp) TaxID=650164 RepID=K5WQU3_PHACS|nr:uncharacterized protein PHACADRAFT_191006 [Phanerochaete carnosa HHB-10118-sp]EKM61815.1 hypothetical protein PHACADRAFT_191006 [Phanerochaete carnosa HHB-10118-sp]
MTDKTFQVAIVGGGVCGIACAIALLKEGVDVHVYEAASEFKEIGAGLGISPNAKRIFKAMGVWDDLITRIVPGQTTKQHAPAQAHVDVVQRKNTWFQFVSGMPGHKVLADWDSIEHERVSYGIHRGIFLDALVHYVDPERLHLHKRCTRITTTGKGVTIHFQDATTASADVILGADGIRSAVRRYVTDTYDVADDPYLKFSRVICYRALIPTKSATAKGVTMDFSKRPICFVGEDRHMIVYAIQGGAMINVAAFVSDPDSAADHYPPASHSKVQTVATSEVLGAYHGWGPEITNLLSCAERLGKWEVNVVCPAIAPEKWTKGQVTILGDAVHGMLPHLGAGAGQGIEDAYLLAKLLGHPQTTLENVTEVLRVYAAVRQPRTQKIWEGSRRAGDMLDGRTHEIHIDELRDMWDYAWNQPLDLDIDTATRMLQENGAYVKSAL